MFPDDVHFDDLIVLFPKHDADHARRVPSHGPHVLLGESNAHSLPGADEDLLGRYVNVKVTRAGPNSLAGECVN